MLAWLSKYEGAHPEIADGTRRQLCAHASIGNIGECLLSIGARREQEEAAANSRLCGQHQFDGMAL